MDKIFGFPMQNVMYILLFFLAIGLLSVIYVAIANPIMFKLGLRNLPRRRAQTVLIVLGLMLSTVIIAAAFTTGDTVNRSVSGEVYALLGSVDEVVHVRTLDTNGGVFSDDVTGVPQRDTSFSEAEAAPLIQAIAASPNVDAVLPSYSDFAVAVNPTARQSAPQFTILGLDPQRSRDLPDLQSTSGGKVTVADLGPGEIYVNQSGADELAIKPGDSIVIYALDQQTTFKVKAVIEDGSLAGSSGIDQLREGSVLPLAAVQQLFGAPGRLTEIVISNQGGTRSGVNRTEDVVSDVEAAIAAHPISNGTLAVIDTKRSAVDFAEQVGSVLVTFFLVLGLFSVGAGILLIFMIFVMLAAERKSEMGMARAVGTKRLDLVQIFLSEGMAYNVLAAAVGCALGVLVSFGMSRVMASLFSSVNIHISPYVSPRSLVISYSLGVVLTFLTVTFSSWRISYINIVRAIRDIPEPPPQKPQWGSRGVFVVLRDLFFKPADRSGWMRRGLIFVGIILLGLGQAAFPLLLVGALLILIGLFTFAWSQKAMPIWLRLASLVGMVLVMPFSLIAGIFMTLQLGPLLLLGGLLDLLFFILGGTNSLFLLLFGLSVAPLGLALTLRSFGANERLTYTSVGVYLIYIWEIDFSVGLVDRIFSPGEGGPEMFFLSGVMVTLAATFVIVYNAELLLGVITWAGRGLGSLVPSLKMAVAYPLASKMRTGMTMAMFCLVIFALVMISSFNYNFNRLLLSDRALGGWDVYVDETPNNPIGDLKAKLQAAGSPVAAKIQAVGLSSIVTGRRARLCQEDVGNDCTPGSDDFNNYQVRGEDQGFLATANIHLQARARGYASDEAVWQAVAKDPSLAVIDANGLQGGFGSPKIITGVDATDKEFDPVTLDMRDAISGQAGTVKVIGVIEQGASSTYGGLHISQSQFSSVFGEPDGRRYFVKTTPGSDNREVAREIESALLTSGAQAESLRYEVDKQNATSEGFFYLIQGFMGLGLFVGVAAIGVIAFRTVVERRQQIGMLRALGYTKGMIGLTFLLESAFIAFAGVMSGIVFALILARQLITEQFANQGGTSFAVPWQQVLLIGGLAFVSAILMTLVPSRQASSIPIAEALRYE